MSAVLVGMGLTYNARASAFHRYRSLRTTGLWLIHLGARPERSKRPRLSASTRVDPLLATLAWFTMIPRTVVRYLVYKLDYNQLDTLELQIRSSVTSHSLISTTESVFDAAKRASIGRPEPINPKTQVPTHGWAQVGTEVTNELT